MVINPIPTAPLLSVVIIGRNEGPRLERCLRSVFAMDHPGGEFEVIYVDSASTDGSPDLAAKMGARVIPVTPGRPTAALGRNAGWRSSSAPYILFLDGDTILHPGFVAASLAELKDEIATVCGNRREIHPETSFYNRVLDLDWISPAGIADYCGGDALTRREALEMVDGYDENLIAGEEPEMCCRMRASGWKILHVDRPMTGHDLAMTRWSQYWRRAVRTGYAYAEVSQRFRRSALPFWEDEARRNRNRALALSGFCLGAVLFSLFLKTLWPFLPLLLIFAALSLRSARKAGWKSADLLTRLLYGIHSHVQQIPISIGQLEYWRDRKSGRIRALIEYKAAAN
jgi:cellulose synthase/poly-beta-1,6-N-acetylglucosamine synthase-like glycosyltransferase